MLSTRHLFVSLTAGLVIALVFAGCLISEATEYRLTLNKDRKGGTFSIIRRNVESNASDSATQQRDFAELLANWKGDQYLLDQMDKGMYVKHRSVALEKGSVVWRETAIFSDIEKLIPNFNPYDTLRIPLHDTTGLHVKTNGVIVVVRDSIVIQWPPLTTQFEVTTTSRDFRPVSFFASRLKRYLKK